MNCICMSRLNHKLCWMVYVVYLHSAVLVECHSLQLEMGKNEHESLVRSGSLSLLGVIKGE